MGQVEDVVQQLQHHQVERFDNLEIRATELMARMTAMGLNVDRLLSTLQTASCQTAWGETGPSNVTVPVPTDTSTSSSSSSNRKPCFNSSSIGSRFPSYSSSSSSSRLPSYSCSSSSSIGRRFPSCSSSSNSSSRMPTCSPRTNSSSSSSRDVTSPDEVDIHQTEEELVKAVQQLSTCDPDMEEWHLVQVRGVQGQQDGCLNGMSLSCCYRCQSA